MWLLIWYCFISIIFSNFAMVLCCMQTLVNLGWKQNYYSLLNFGVSADIVHHLFKYDLSLTLM